MAEANGATITTVQIKATVDTSKAQASLTRLAEKIRGLRTAVGTGIKLPTANRIEQIGEAFKSWKGIRWGHIANGINNVADALGRISVLKIDSSIVRQMQKIQTEMSSTKAKAKEMSDAIQDSTSLYSTGHTIDTTLGGGKNPLGTIRNVGKGGHFVGDTLGGGNNPLGRSGHDFSFYDMVLGGDAKKAEESMRSAIKASNAYEASLIRLNLTAAKTSIQLSRLASVLNVLRGIMLPFKAIVKGVFSGIGHAIQGIAKSMVTISKKNTFKALGALASLSVAPYKRLGKSIASVTARLTGFFSAVRRIAVYRAIRWALKELTQAFREGIANLYQYSLVINGQFAKSMDMLATSALYAKNSLAAMVAPLVNVLAPAVDYVVDKFVDLLNTINELFATLTGASTWTKALKYPIAYAEAADGANGKAKELRATLLGFDEINRLDDNKRGSRGSAAEQLDYSKMFEEQVTTSKLSNIVGALKDAFTSGDFTDIGKAVGEKIKKGLDSIPWESIKERVKKNAKSVATFINGIVSTDGLAESVGTTIAEAFNTVTDKISTFFSEVKWDKVGKFVGTSINTAIKKINFTELGQTISGVIKSALTFAKSLLVAIDWQDVGRKIGEFLNGIDFTEVLLELGETLSELIGDAIDAAWELIKTSPVAGTAAIAFLGLKFGSLLGVNMATGVASSGLTGKIAALIPTAATLTITAFVMYHIGDKLYDYYSDGVKQDLENLVKWFDNGLADAFGIETEAYQNMKKSWQAAKDMTESYYALAQIGEAQRQFLLNKGYSDETVRNAKQLSWLMEQIDKENEMRLAMGLQTNELATQLRKQQLLAQYTDEEIQAWRDITKETIKIRFEAQFGSWTDFAEKIKKAFTDTKNSIKSTFTNIGNTIGGWISDALGIDLNVTTTNQGSGKLSTVTTLKKKAGGGDVQTGSMFIAGEAGAELVYAASGKTTVSNRDQIADSVAAGNEEGNEILRELLSVARTISSKEFTSVAQITTGQITSALNRANVRSGSTVVPVQGG